MDWPCEIKINFQPWSPNNVVRRSWAGRRAGDDMHVGETKRRGAELETCADDSSLESYVTRPCDQQTTPFIPFPPSLPPATMAAAADEGQFLKQATGRNTRGLLRVIILCLIAGAAVSSRLFSVIRFESIIHECQCSNGRTHWINWLMRLCSRSLVQLQGHKIPGAEWLLQLLGLVR